MTTRILVAFSAHEVDRFSLAALGLLALGCLLAGIFPGFLIDALAPAVNAITAAHLPGQASQPWLTLVPIDETRSSYNGLLVFVFMLVSGLLGAFAIHRVASDKVRRSAAWDCGYPEPSVLTQYSASSLAQPIRRVFGTVVFGARELGEMPPPASTAPARLTVVVHDPVWEIFYAPISGLVTTAAERLNVLQFLTIRRYLSLVFAALVLLLLVLAATS